MQAFAVNRDWLVGHRIGHEPIENAVKTVEHLAARAINIIQAQRHRGNVVHFVVQQNILLRGELVDAVNIRRLAGMLFIHRQILRLADLAARAGENDSRAIRLLAENFEKV